MSDEKKHDKSEKSAKPPKPPKGDKPAGKADKAAPAPKAERVAREPEPKTVRLLEHYRQVVRPRLLSGDLYKNPMAVPRIRKITVNMGIGKATENRNRIEIAVRELGQITGQRPVVTRARKSVAGFKLRQGQPIGCKVTLRGKRMYEFMDRLISIVLPRVRDFRGLPSKAFDRHGNYTLGLPEQIVFPEIEIDKVEFPQGMDITFSIATPKPEGSYEFLKLMGMPFQE
jgi:large subunit ribosomal protein L5